MNDLSRKSVVAAVVERDGRFLVCQRPNHKKHGGLWEFPGGKLEMGEGLREAAERELKEELRLQVHTFGEVQFSIADKLSGCEVNFVQVNVIGEPILLEHIALSWLNLTDLLGIALAPSDEAFVNWMCSFASTP